MTIATTLTEPVQKQSAPRWNQIATLVLLVAAADWLLFRQPAGLGWAVLIMLLALGLLLPVASRLNIQALLWRAALAGAAILPLAENVSEVSLLSALCGMAMFAFACSGRLRTSGGAILHQLVGFFVLAPFRLMIDAIKLRHLHVARGDRWRLLALSLIWVVPVVFGGLFLVLFGIANPVIEDWLDCIDLLALLGQLDPERIAFWTLMAAGLWAYLRPRFLRRPKAKKVQTVKRDDPVFDLVFGPQALLRALIMFNLLFAVQNGLDMLYLWGGVALPHGMTYAAYAHRGAYALIATALLAAGFVLAAMRPGSAMSENPMIRTLVYLWTGQNIWLVGSSMLRLDLYVDTYALTYWRVAAFIWMALVALGLGLIIARIAFEKSNQWLVSANLMTLSAVLYGCCFINFAAVIADYNVEHSLEMRGTGQPIDLYHLSELGPQALPGLDKLATAASRLPSCGGEREWCLDDIIKTQRHTVAGWQTNWRYATFRNLRLIRYLEQNPVPALPTGAIP